MIKFLITFSIGGLFGLFIACALQAGREYEKDKEIERLNNVINELEKWLEEENYKNEDFWCINSVEVLNKLRELKEGK